MLKNLKLGAKISLGFATVICLASVLGTLGVVSMNVVRRDAGILAREYMPEVEICNQVERNSLLAMYAMRGYALSEDPKYLEQGKGHLAEVDKWLGEAGKLADEAEHLVKLGPAVAATRKSVDEYEDLTKRTEDLIGKLDQNRATLNTAAAAFMENANAYLRSQDAALTEEIGKGAKGAKLRERHEKITAANDIIDLGNATRIANWKAQAERNPQLITDADRNFEQLAAKFEYLRERTHQEANLQQIAATQEAGNTYRATMQELLANWQELQTVGTRRTEVGTEVLAQAQATAAAGVEGASRIAKEASANLTASSMTLLIGLIVCIAIGTISALMITRSIVGPLRRLINGLTAGSQQTASAAGSL